MIVPSKVVTNYKEFLGELHKVGNPREVLERFDAVQVVYLDVLSLHVKIKEAQCDDGAAVQSVESDYSTAEFEEWLEGMDCHPLFMKHMQKYGLELSNLKGENKAIECSLLTTMLHLRTGRKYLKKNSWRILLLGASAVQADGTVRPGHARPSGSEAINEASTGRPQREGPEGERFSQPI